jgi:uncharacterized protein (DUF1499 family)
LAIFKNPANTFLLFLCLLLVSCSQGNRIDMRGLQNGKLATCPTSPNCVSSDVTDAKHYIEPLRLTAPAAEAWKVVQVVVADLPRTQIIVADESYLQAECRSRVFGFVDDLELQLRPQEKMIAVRSAARLGYSDFGVNRKRIEALRTELSRRGLVAAAER